MLSPEENKDRWVLFNLEKNMKNKILHIAFSLAVVGLFAASASADDRFSVEMENDFIFNKDCDYTHSTRLEYQHDDYVFAFGQNMYTPNNKKADYPLPDQHPYAGYLYGELGYMLDDEDENHYFGLQLGVVGPHSYAEDTQKFIHKMIGDVDPKGWKYQLSDEFVFQLIYTHRQEFLLVGDRSGWNAKLIGKIGESSGLAQVYGFLGAELRLGYNTYHGSADDIVLIAAVRNDNPWSVYGILGGEFRAYAWNIFLDGNYAHDSMSVDSKWDVWEGRAGFGFDVYGLDGRALWVWRTKEYETQLKNTQFMSVQLGYTF